VSEERPTAGEQTERALRWAATMGGYPGGSGRVRQAHAGDDQIRLTPVPPVDRAEREAAEEEALAPAATRSGPDPRRRAREEEPDTLRTCFEQDRDRILHSSAFRRLAGKTQVFIFPADHQRTRLTHALEVAQVATSIARACRLNVALTEAIALGHDCGHGPGGHASEDAFSVFVPGFDHAVWGADVTAAPLNLCRETLDGIRNHSWSRPAPATPEGQVVGLADRVAYCAHDLEDAVAAGLVDLAELPPLVAERAGVTRSAQLHAFITDIVTTISSTGLVGLSEAMGEALAALRSFNHERVYLRPESRAQADLVIDLLRALVEHLAAHPDRLPVLTGDPLLDAVTYVDGMTDRYACSTAVSLLGWDPDRLPRGQDTGSG
jgi:dGTPase